MRRQLFVSLCVVPLLMLATQAWGGPLQFFAASPASPAGCPDGKLTLIPDAEKCYKVGDIFEVAIRMSDIEWCLGDGPVVGGQFFLRYNPDVLRPCQDPARPGDPPFLEEDHENIGNGLIDYAVGIEFGDKGTNEDTNMAYLCFEALTEWCGNIELALWWRDHVPPTRLTDDMANSLEPPALVLDDKSSPIIIDETPPVFQVDCKNLEPIEVECDEIEFHCPPVKDNCDPDPKCRFEEDHREPGRCLQEYTVWGTWIATDFCGNEARCGPQIIYVVDTTAPEFVEFPPDFPPDDPLECDESTHPDRTGWPKVEDNCDPNLDLPTWDDEDNQDPDPKNCGHYRYTIWRTWCTKDDCDNENCRIQTINVDDTKAPEWTYFPPTPLPIECDYCPGYPTPQCTGRPTAEDNCDPKPKITYDDEVIRDPGCPEQQYTVERTWCVEDACGNENCRVQTIEVKDTTAPEIDCDLTELWFECDEPLIIPPPEAVDNCDPAPKVWPEDEIIPGKCPQEYDIHRTWCAKDACGNKFCCPNLQIIHVVDTTAPVFTEFPEDVTIECDYCDPPYPEPECTGAPKAEDNCDPDPKITYEDEVRHDHCPQSYFVTRTWKACDACGNCVEDVQRIEVQDTTAPEITERPAHIFVNADAGKCEAAVLLCEVLEAEDNCDPDVDIVGVRTDNNCVYKVGDPLPDCWCEPFPVADCNFINWTATDDCGNVAGYRQKVCVAPFNEVVVDVELSPHLDPGDYLERCIRFEFWKCPSPSGQPDDTVDQTIAFPVDAAPHLAKDVVVLVECGLYNCVTARDINHTLRSTAPSLDIVGKQYKAQFVGERPDGHYLVNGNLNGDEYIDVLDFGVFVAEYDCLGGRGCCYPTKDWPCGSEGCARPEWHADISGDTIVFTGDREFYKVNFLMWSEPNCCDAGGDSGGQGPITRISVRALYEMGLPELVVADLNGDGWLDEADVDAFDRGVRPKPKVFVPWR